MFKIGQRVKIIKRSCHHYTCEEREEGCIGQLGMISEFDEDYEDGRSVVVRFDSPFCGFCNLNKDELVPAGGEKEEIE